MKHTNNNSEVVLPRVLIYQRDDSSIMASYLATHGFQVIRTTEDNVLNKIKEWNFDLCILDSYNDSEPLYLLKYMRKVDSIKPIIIVSDRVDPSFIIQAFDACADDYVARPYNIEVLIRRMKCLLRRLNTKLRSIELAYELGDYTFDVEEGVLFFKSTQIELNAKLVKILTLLCAYKNEFILKKTIMQQVWPSDNYLSRRSLDVYMCTLRGLLKQDSRIKIETRHGVGYRLLVESDYENLM